MGREERQTALNSIRRLDLKYLLLAVAFPVGIAMMIPLAEYLPAPVQWAAHDFGRFGPPQLGAYFSLPEPWLFLLFFASLCEELIFRGLLQPRFIRRYGLYRGIFLVGIVWAALAYVLFRYWPVRVEDSLEPASELPSLESAG